MDVKLATLIKSLNIMDVIFSGFTVAEPSIPIYNSYPDPIDPQKTIKERNDQLNYCRVNENSKPIMCNCARRYLCTPPGSIASERLFSTAGDIADGACNRMLSEKS